MIHNIFVNRVKRILNCHNSNYNINMMIDIEVMLNVDEYDDGTYLVSGNESSIFDPLN